MPAGGVVASDQIIEANQQTVRLGPISGALKKKRGMNVISEKGENGERVYRIAAE